MKSPHSIIPCINPLSQIKKELLVLLPALFLLMSCLSDNKSTGTSEYPLTRVAESEHQWTGVAVSSEGRVFVNYPNWSDNVPLSVAEIVDGKPRAYPDMEWNQRFGTHYFNAVQSVFVDTKNRLWVLETNNPQFTGVTGSGPVLYHFSLETDRMVKAYSFPGEVYTKHSYFNDVRIDTEKEIAYITDSGDGALIVLNLATGLSRRLLDNHSSTQSEIDHLVCDGYRFENSVHSDGIGLSPDNRYLYYIALTGHTLYRIKTEVLLDEQLSAEALAAGVEAVKNIPATDGILFDQDGTLYLGGLETNAVNRLTTEEKLETLIQSPRIRWADSFALDTEGNLYFTTSQIHIPEQERLTYEVLKISIK